MTPSTIVSFMCGFLLSVLCLLLLMPGVALASPSADQRTWHFRALLDGQPIGHHYFSLQQNGNQRTLSSEARFEVKFLFFNVYDYEHTALERWNGDCLQEITASTDDNGNPLSLSGAEESSRFVISTRQGRQQLPACVMSFAYWNPAILEQTRLLNPQTGEYEPVAIRYLGQETLTVNGNPVVSDRYQLRTGEQQITLWYASDDRRWLGLESLIEGKYTLRYELQTAG